MKSKLVLAVAVFATAFLYPASAWAAVTLQSAVIYAVENSPRSLTTADVNGDGLVDVVAANYNSDTVSVLLGDDFGTFLSATPSAVAVGNAPTSLAAGDLNGDTFLDIVTANDASADVTVLIGNGDGTFDPAAAYAVNGLFGERSVAIADLDGDTDLDLAVANQASSTVSVLLNDGSGVFAPAIPELYPVGLNPSEVVIGDINGDPNPDIVTANLSGGSVSVLLGNGNGTFQPEQTYVNGGSVGSLAIGNFNAGGIPDLVITVNNSVAVQVLLGNGDGTFTPGQQKSVGTGPSSVAIGDVDADGTDDLAVTNQVDGTVGVLTGNGDGTFDDQVDFPVGGVSPHSVRLAHLDGDSRLDIITANANSNTVSVLLTRSDFTTGPTATISGTVRQGQTLTANEGTPVPTQDSFTYEWLADGVTIGGANAKTFKLTAAQVGKKISVTVTAIKAGLNDASDTSPETVAVVGIFTPGPNATITGTARVGWTLYAKAGSPSPTPTALTYRWYANGAKLSTTTRTLKLTSAHHGKRIQVRVYASKSGYLTAADLSPATAGVSSLRPKVISMELNDYTVKRGQRVYAEIELLAAGEPWSIVLDGKKLTSGNASSTGIARTSFVVPATATRGERILRAYGKFTDRTDPDRITIR